MAPPRRHGGCDWRSVAFTRDIVSSIAFNYINVKGPDSTIRHYGNIYAYLMCCFAIVVTFIRLVKCLNKSLPVKLTSLSIPGLKGNFCTEEESQSSTGCGKAQV